MDPQVKAARHEVATKRLYASLGAICSSVGVAFTLPDPNAADKDLRALEIQEGIALQLEPVAETIQKVIAGAPKPTKLTKKLEAENAELSDQVAALNAKVAELTEQLAHSERKRRTMLEAGA